jgi:hypothetical protein
MSLVHTADGKGNVDHEKQNENDIAAATNGLFMPDRQLFKREDLESVTSFKEYLVPVQLYNLFAKHIKARVSDHVLIPPQSFFTENFHFSARPLIIHLTIARSLSYYDAPTATAGQMQRYRAGGEQKGDQCSVHLRCIAG